MKAEIIIQVEKSICSECKKNDALEPHTCPYLEEINCNTETLCTCCEMCQYQCSQDI